MAKFAIHNMDLYYNTFHALKNINLELPEHEVSAFIGPSGCGKSTLLKSLNRMNDLVEGCKITGDIRLDGEDIYGDMDVNLLRKRVGMVFQKANPFPMSIYDNIAYGPRTHGIHSKAKLDEIVENSLRSAAIWDEGQRPSEQECTGHVRRTAAAALYRTGTGSTAGSAPHGRTHQCTGSDLHFQGGRSGAVAEKGLYHYYCNPQHAAGNPCV